MGNFLLQLIAARAFGERLLRGKRLVARGPDKGAPFFSPQA
jgi:hypothetical protein